MTEPLNRPPPPPQAFIDKVNGALTPEAYRWCVAVHQLLTAGALNVSTTVTQLFDPVALTAVAQTLYTVATNPDTTVLRSGRMRFTNVTGGAITVTAYAVPAGGAAANGNAFLLAKSVPANDFIDVDIPLMGPGDFLQALASAPASITATALDGVIYA